MCRKYGHEMNYKISCFSTGKPVDALQMHVFARAYQDAWRIVHTGEPLGTHTIEELDLVIEFAEEERVLKANEVDLRAVIAEMLGDRPNVTGPAQSDLGQSRAKRVLWQSLVDLGDAKGVMRDISASGVFFETVDTFPFSSLTNFELDLGTSNSNICLKCRGEIVRIEPRLKKVGVAVKLIEASIVVR